MVLFQFGSDLCTYASMPLRWSQEPLHVYCVQNVASLQVRYLYLSLYRQVCMRIIDNLIDIARRKIEYITRLISSGSSFPFNLILRFPFFPFLSLVITVDTVGEGNIRKENVVECDGEVWWCLLMASTRRSGRHFECYHLLRYAWWPIQQDLKLC